MWSRWHAKAASASQGPKARRWRIRAVWAAGLALLLAIAVSGPWVSYLNRLGIDALLPLRHAIFGPLYGPADSLVVVVAIDEESYRSAPFANSPKVAWTKHIAEVLIAIDSASPKVIGLDVVYPTTLDQKGLLQGYDRPFLRALFKSGRAGRLVMGRVQFGDQIIQPNVGQLRAVGGPGNVRLLNLLVDRDNIVRRYPLAYDLPGGKKEPSFAAELANRFLGKNAAMASGLAGKSSFLINFNTGPEAIPVHSFADLWRCSQAGVAGHFRKYFAEKVVLFGSYLDVEDRKIPASHFVLGASERTPPAGARPRCTPQGTSSTGGAARSTLPGVLIHADAINTLLRRNPLRTLSTLPTFVLTLSGGFIMALAFFMLPPVLGALAGILALFVLATSGAVSLQYGLVLPVIPLGLSVIFAHPASYAYRFAIEDREKRLIKHAFQHYLAPALIEDLAENPGALRLGGVRKPMSIFFSDIAGFTTISEAMADEPERLVELMNQYLTRVTVIIENHGGYVDKFIGDAVMAIWGAPLDDHLHALHAVEAALEIRHELDRFNVEVVQRNFQLDPIGTRMGINSGIAIVGNMGSAHRFNYTVTGDIVNLSARLEGANKAYGTDLMIGQDTARAIRLAQRAAGIMPDAADAIILRRLDKLVVKGKTRPVKVFDVVGRRDSLSANHLQAIRLFHQALALYYKREFEQALSLFATLTGDFAAKVYVQRCRRFADAPPPADWDGSFTMTTK